MDNINKDEPFVLTGILEKDAEPILDENKELGCLLTVREKHALHKVELFSLIAPVLYKKALKGTRVVIPVSGRKARRLRASLVYPI